MNFSEVEHTYPLKWITHYVFFLLSQNDENTLGMGHFMEIYYFKGQ